MLSDSLPLNILIALYGGIFGFTIIIILTIIGVNIFKSVSSRRKKSVKLRVIK